MIFSSTTFLFIFLPTVLLGYFLIRRELKNTFLLVMSLLFYAVGEPSFVWIMIASIIVNYVLGILIAKTENTNKIFRRSLLVLVILVNLSILFYYKYFDFFITNCNYIFGTSVALRNITLPIGISFFTFQGMSYVLDVYMGKTAVQKNPFNVALYVAFFPQLIAGPIVRYSDINEQITFRKENLDDFAYGIKRFAVGLAKKTILSNTFALLADQVFNTSSTELGRGLAWLGAFAYMFQIYFDFSGYSDMAIGLGRMFGFHFLENFNHPYISTNLTNFWRRWHISLSSWFRDYVYIPIGGNRRGNVYLHLLTIFFLTGFWHGASWNFIIWGLWHGLFLIIERILRNHKITIPLPKVFKWLYTMLVVIVGWVFFRAKDLQSALIYLETMFNIFADSNDGIWTMFYIREYFVVFIIGIVASTPIVQIIENKYFREDLPLCEYKGILSSVLSLLLLLGSIGLLTVTTYNPFIYFNF